MLLQGGACATGTFGGAVQFEQGDMLEVLRQYPDDCFDSCVCDPPYHLTSIVKRFGGEDSAPAQFGKDGAYARASRGFMGKTWDGGDVAFRIEAWAEVYRVLKPGAYVLAFSGSRTYHRMACAIEDAGFEIRDQIMWVYGSGFPKSHDVSKAIDKAAGAERERIAGPKSGGMAALNKGNAAHGYREAAYYDDGNMMLSNEPATEAAQQWQGWGTALKPAHEPICFARKPLIGTVAENVLAHGTGAINIDGCRVATDPAVDDPRLGGVGAWKTDKAAKNVYEGGYAGEDIPSSALGRFPANFIHDGSEEVLAAFPNASGQLPAVGPQHGAMASVNVYGDYGPRNDFQPRNDSGSAARFFKACPPADGERLMYCAKASRSERAGSAHPTIKPLALMRYLCRLVTPPDGLVLDPFAGSGTTGEAAVVEGFRAVLIDLSEDTRSDLAARESR